MRWRDSCDRRFCRFQIGLGDWRPCIRLRAASAIIQSTPHAQTGQSRTLAS